MEKPITRIRQRYLFIFVFLGWTFIPPFSYDKSEPAVKKARKEDTSCGGLVNGTVREEQGEGGEGQEEKGNSATENEKISSEVITYHVHFCTLPFPPPLPPPSLLLSPQNWKPR